ncbi:hypothetical protein CsatB_013349 [Cannabis sativa]
MSAIEKLWIQIFERKSWIIDQVKQQTSLYDKHLASKLLIDGITPPPWLGGTLDSTELNCEDLISGVLLSRPRPVIPFAFSHCSVYDEPIAEATNRELPNGSCTKVSVENRELDGLDHARRDRECDGFDYAECASVGVSTMDQCNTIVEDQRMEVEDGSVTSPQEQRDAGFLDVRSETAFSLAKIQRSKSRQKALEIRTGTKAAKSRLKNAINSGENIPIPSFQDDQPEQLNLVNPAVDNSNNICTMEGVKVGDSCSKEKESSGWQHNSLNAGSLSNVVGEDGIALEESIGPSIQQYNPPPESAHHIQSHFEDCIAAEAKVGELRRMTRSRSSAKQANYDSEKKSGPSNLAPQAQLTDQSQTAKSRQKALEIRTGTKAAKSRLKNAINSGENIPIPSFQDDQSEQLNFVKPVVDNSNNICTVESVIVGDSCSKEKESSGWQHNSLNAGSLSNVVGEDGIAIEESIGPSINQSNPPQECANHIQSHYEDCIAAEAKVGELRRMTRSRSSAKQANYDSEKKSGSGNLAPQAQFTDQSQTVKSANISNASYGLKGKVARSLSQTVKSATDGCFRRVTRSRSSSQPHNTVYDLSLPVKSSNTRNFEDEYLSNTTDLVLSASKSSQQDKDRLISAELFLPIGEDQELYAENSTECSDKENTRTFITEGTPEVDSSQNLGLQVTHSKSAGLKEYLETESLKSSKELGPNKVSCDELKDSPISSTSKPADSAAVMETATHIDEQRVCFGSILIGASDVGVEDFPQHHVGSTKHVEPKQLNFDDVEPSSFDGVSALFVEKNEEERLLERSPLVLSESGGVLDKGVSLEEREAFSKERELRNCSSEAFVEEADTNIIALNEDAVSAVSETPQAEKDLATDNLQQSEKSSKEKYSLKEPLVTPSETESRTPGEIVSADRLKNISSVVHKLSTHADYTQVSIPVSFEIQEVCTDPCSVSKDDIMGNQAMSTENLEYSQCRTAGSSEKFTHDATDGCLYQSTEKFEYTRCCTADSSERVAHDVTDVGLYQSTERQIATKSIVKASVGASLEGSTRNKRKRSGSLATLSTSPGANENAVSPLNRDTEGRNLFPEKHGLKDVVESRDLQSSLDDIQLEDNSKSQVEGMPQNEEDDMHENSKSSLKLLVEEDDCSLKDRDLSETKMVTFANEELEASHVSSVVRKSAGACDVGLYQSTERQAAVKSIEKASVGESLEVSTRNNRKRSGSLDALSTSPGAKENAVSPHNRDTEGRNLFPEEHGLKDVEESRDLQSSQDDIQLDIDKFQVDGMPQSEDDDMQERSKSSLKLLIQEDDYSLKDRDSSATKHPMFVSADEEPEASHVSACDALLMEEARRMEDPSSFIFDGISLCTLEEDKFSSHLEEKFQIRNAESLTYSDSLHLIDADETMPVLESFVLQSDDEQPCIADQRISFDKLSLPNTSIERASILEELCRSTCLQTPVSCSSVSNKLPKFSNIYQSVPTGLLEGMDKPKDDYGCLSEAFSCAFEERSYSDCLPSSTSQFDWEIKKPCLSPVRKVWDRIISKSDSSEKRMSVVPELPSICEENENVDEVAYTYREDNVAKDLTSSVKRAPLADVIANIAASEAEQNIDRSSLDSVNTEFSFNGTHKRTKQKIGNGKGIKRRYNNKENDSMSSLGTAGPKGKLGLFHNRFSKPKVSSTRTSSRRGGPSLTVTEPKPSNIVSNITSFIPLVQQKQAAAVATGKRDVKVKALGAAEAARRLAEKKEDERKAKKEAMKLERARLEQENLKQLEMQKKQKEMERKKKEADMAAKKRQREEEEKKERDRKRMRVEETKRQQRENERKLNAQKEEKDAKHRTVDDRGHETKESKDEKRNLHKKMEQQNGYENLQTLTETEHATTQASTSDARSSSELVTNLKMNNLDKPTGADNVEQSYDISPYKCSDDEDEEEDDDSPNKKFVPSWARKSSVALLVSSQDRIDPETIFPPDSFCSIAEDSKRRFCEMECS